MQKKLHKNIRFKHSKLSKQVKQIDFLQKYFIWKTRRDKLEWHI